MGNNLKALTAENVTFEITDYFIDCEDNYYRTMVDLEVDVSDKETGVKIIESHARIMLPTSRYKYESECSVGYIEEDEYSMEDYIQDSVEIILSLYLKNYEEPIYAQICDSNILYSVTDGQIRTYIIKKGKMIEADDDEIQNKSIGFTENFENVEKQCREYWNYFDYNVDVERVINFTATLANEQSYNSDKVEITQALSAYLFSNYNSTAAANYFNQYLGMLN